MTESQCRRPAEDRARRRAVRAKAAEADVPYSVAARWLAETGGMSGSHGRTIYPPSPTLTGTG